MSLSDMYCNQVLPFYLYRYEVAPNDESLICTVISYKFYLSISAGRTYVKSINEKICFSYFSTKTYVVGTQKNRLNETVLLNTQNIC